MNTHKAERPSDMTDRLRHLEQLLAPTVPAPTVVAQRTAPDEETASPLLDVQLHTGRIYVAGHEPHFRPVTLLARVRASQAGAELA